MERIVVGVDGSQGSVEALRWAADEAKLRGARLRAVITWDPYAYSGISDAVVVPRFDQIEIDTMALLESAIEKAVDDPDLRASIERLVVEGHPTHVLRAQSNGADLLVVGARGHSGIVGLLLGSTADQIARHASCPVVVVRGPRKG